MMNQMTRPDQIDKILDKIDTQFPDEMGNTLETYISTLETNQQDVDFKDTTRWDPDKPSVWSQARVEERAKRRHERAARKRNDYQSIKPL
jgi:hypothetical protein